MDKTTQLYVPGKAQTWVSCTVHSRVQASITSVMQCRWKEAHRNICFVWNHHMFMGSHTCNCVDTVTFPSALLNHMCTDFYISSDFGRHCFSRAWVIYFAESIFSSFFGCPCFKSFLKTWQLSGSSFTAFELWGLFTWLFELYKQLIEPHCKFYVDKFI